MIDTVIQAFAYVVGRQSEFWIAVGDHLALVGVAMFFAILLGVPFGIWTARSRAVSLVLMNTVTALRVVPSLAILFLIVPFMGLSTASAAVALTILALPPIVLNTDAGFRSVEPAVLDAARGMGMSAAQVFRRVEVPLALPVVLTGIRTAMVEVISSATLAAFVGSGGLGIYITRGFALYDFSILIVGAFPVAVLTLMAEAILSMLQKNASPSFQEPVST